MVVDADIKLSRERGTKVDSKYLQVYRQIDNLFPRHKNLHKQIVKDIFLNLEK